MSSTQATEHEIKSPSRAMTEWLERQYDEPQQVDGGPEALAWDDHGLQVAGRPAAVQV